MSSAESEDDEPPARYILTDFAKKWAPDMVKDSAPVDDDPQACAFGFSDAVPHSPPGLVQADDGLCGAFLRGVNYHIKSPSQHMKALLNSLPSCKPGTPRYEFPPLPAGAYAFQESAAKMPTFLSTAALRDRQSLFPGWAPPSIPKDISGKWSSVCKGFLYLHEASALSSLLMASPQMDLDDRGQILRQFRRMLLGAAFTMGSLGHGAMSDARQLHLKVMGEHSSPRFASEPFGIASPLGDAGRELWNSGPSAMAQTCSFLQKQASSRQHSSGRSQDPKKSKQGQKFRYQKSRAGPYKRPKSQPAQNQSSNSGGANVKSNQSQAKSSQRGSRQGGQKSKKRF